VQKDLLANKLEIGLDSDRPRATRPNLPLCKVVKCQLCEIARIVLDIQPAVRPYSDFITQLCDTVRPGLNFTVARSRPTLALVVGFKSSDNTKAGHLLKLV
jgi:hypothetical protein